MTEKSPGPKLEPLELARLETLLWKQRTLGYRAKEAATVARSRADEAAAADSDFRSLAAAAGIDVRRPFEWDADGQVVYLGPDPDPPVIPATLSKDGS
jgi:hypothetical protein